MKRLVCCLDGTWNNDDAGAVPTNVVKLHRAVLPEDAAGVSQVSHYVKGIASANDIRAQFLKGAVGYEVGDRIRDGYRFFVDTYQPGDEIFLFGFSRGAFEARSLAGFITLFGIAKKDAGFSVDEAWALYRQSPSRRSAAALEKLRAAAHYPVRIKCVGVWDTVGNIGNPFFSSGLLGRWTKFHDTRLHPSIEVGLHALSIDEVRGPFRPSLWTRPRDAPPTPGQHVEQVWFAGSHANVGGGFPETELSDIALLWMAERANATAGLALDIDALLRAAKPNALGLQHASATGSLFKWSGRLPFIRLINQRAQAIPRLRRTLIGSWRSNKLERAEITVNERVHESVLARFGKTVNEATGETLNEIVYQPRNIAALIDAQQTVGEATNMADTATQANGAAQTSSSGASPLTKLVTVHGTGAGHKECTGERWWQRGSPFLAELAKRLNLDPARVEIVPFHWDLGPNSETGRRAASRAQAEPPPAPIPHPTGRTAARNCTASNRPASIRAAHGAAGFRVACAATEWDRQPRRRRQSEYPVQVGELGAEQPLERRHRFVRVVFARPPEPVRALAVGELPQRGSLLLGVQPAGGNNMIEARLGRAQQVPSAVLVRRSDPGREVAVHPTPGDERGELAERRWRR